MLKVNVGLSRKLSRDYNSTGFSLNIEGEVCVGLDDPEAVIEKIKEFYDLAEETLSQQIERYEGESAIASRDQQQPVHSNGHPTGTGSKEPPNNGTLFGDNYPSSPIGGSVDQSQKSGRHRDSQYMTE